MSSEMSVEAATFYEQGILSFNGFQGRGGIVLGMTVNAPAKEIIASFEPEDAIGQEIGTNIRRLYESVEVRDATIDRHTYSFEMGLLAGSDTNGERTCLRNATFNSSLTTNPGNGFELARDVFLDRGTTQVYVGAPGVGMSSPLTPAEQRYVRKHGSLLDVDKSGNVTALPYVRALGKVLRSLGVTITDLHSDSAGALPSLAYGAAYGNGNILTAHQNVRPGMRDIGALSLAYEMLGRDRRLSKKHARLSPDALKVSGKSEFIDRYIGLSEQYAANDFKGDRSLAMLLTNLIGVGRGPLHGDPLITDNKALAKSNPNAQVLFTIGAFDPLSIQDRSQSRLRLSKILGEISSRTDRSVNAVVFQEMPHTMHTYYPQYLSAVSRFLLQ